MPATSTHSGHDLDITSDAIDEGTLTASFVAPCSPHRVTVNVLKGKIWNDKSEFDETVDKSQFRDYESACDRVKNFYKEQHGRWH